MSLADVRAEEDRQRTRLKKLLRHFIHNDNDNDNDDDDDDD